MHDMTLRLKSDASAMALGSCLRQDRQRRKMTRLTLARKLGMDQSQISRIERGRMSFVSRNVQNICIFLDVQPGLFVDDPLVDQVFLQSRLLRLNALLGGQKNGDAAAVSRLLDALEAFAEAYAT